MRRWTTLSLPIAVVLALSACGGGGGTAADSSAAAGPPQAGGDLTVLEGVNLAGSWPTGLDPATDATGGANLPQMQAIYGGLFLLRADDDGSNAALSGEQAESGTLSEDGKTLTVKLKDGITFSDGTPLDAQAVATNWERDLDSPCSCKPDWKLAPEGIQVVDPLTVSVTFTQANAAVLDNFPISNVNWIASPTALEQLGEDAFRLEPVGAGPFVVQDNALNSTLTLTKNPTYYREGLPYLDKLTFQSIGGDQPAYQALQAGQAQAFEGLTTTSLMDQAQSNSNLTMTLQPSTSVYDIQLNTTKAPFDDDKARQAIYAATDWAAIGKGLFNDRYPTSTSFVGSGGRFHPLEVTGYQEYDLGLAKDLVTELGGLSIELSTVSNPTYTAITTALQTQWQEAGIDVTLRDEELSGVINQFSTSDWDVMVLSAGSFDPAAGRGVSYRYSSTSTFSGVEDETIDQLIAQAAQSQDDDTRKDLYQQVAQRIADQHYSPFGLAFSSANLAVSGVHGPGLTTKIPPIGLNTSVIWDEVWRSE